MNSDLSGMRKLHSLHITAEEAQPGFFKKTCSCCWQKFTYAPSMDAVSEIRQAWVSHFNYETFYVASQIGHKIERDAKSWNCSCGKEFSQAQHGVFFKKDAMQHARAAVEEGYK